MYSADLRPGRFLLAAVLFATGTACSSGAPSIEDALNPQTWKVPGVSAKLDASTTPQDPELVEAHKRVQNRYNILLLKKNVFDTGKNKNTESYLSKEDLVLLEKVLSSIPSSFLAIEDGRRQVGFGIMSDGTTFSHNWPTYEIWIGGDDIYEGEASVLTGIVKKLVYRKVVDPNSINNPGIVDFENKKWRDRFTQQTGLQYLEIFGPGQERAPQHMFSELSATYLMGKKVFIDGWESEEDRKISEIVYNFMRDNIFEGWEYENRQIKSRPAA